MANEEHLKILKQGVAAWNKWRSGARRSEVDLTRAQLRSVDLSGADLTEADLRSVDLRGADLRRAALCYTDLSGAKLCAAKLIRADLTWILVWPDKRIERITPSRPLWSFNSKIDPSYSFQPSSFPEY
jgi:hypothetical protein